MKITETTPPIKRTYSIDFSENELKILGVIMGGIIPLNIKKVIDQNDWETVAFPGVSYDPVFVISFYDKLARVFEA